jgi:transcriptional regulator with XRE-family HTH domain
MRGLTQRQLGQAIDVSSGQMHKIEHGLNQVSAGLLYQIAHVLDVPIVYFYRDVRTAHIAIRSRNMLMELILNFSSIQNDKRRDAFAQLVRVLAAREGATEDHVAADHCDG